MVVFNFLLITGILGALAWFLRENIRMRQEILNLSRENQNMWMHFKSLQDDVKVLQGEPFVNPSVFITPSPKKQKRGKRTAQEIIQENLDAERAKNLIDDKTGS